MDKPFQIPSPKSRGPRAPPTPGGYFGRPGLGELELLGGGRAAVRQTSRQRALGTAGVEADRGLRAEGAGGAALSGRWPESGREGQWSCVSSQCPSWVRRPSPELLLTLNRSRSWGSPPRTGGCWHEDGPFPHSPSSARTNFFSGLVQGSAGSLGPPWGVGVGAAEVRKILKLDLISS